MSESELREKLAAIEHERWADWQKWCHKVLRENNPSPEQGDILERWDRQIETPYAELSEAEKQSDRDQVDRYWSLIHSYGIEREEQAVQRWLKTVRQQSMDDKRRLAKQMKNEGYSLSQIQKAFGYRTKSGAQSLVATLQSQQKGEE